MTQIPGKIEPLIQAVSKVTSAPAHFWDRGARWFVARFYGLRQLETSCSVFFRRRFAGSLRKADFEAVPRKKKSCRRGRPEATRNRGRDIGHDVMATRGDWKLGANGCRIASWSDGLVGANSLTATPRRVLLLSGCLRTSRTPDPYVHHMIC